MKEAPFYVGQKVVCNTPTLSYKVGEVYTVGMNRFCEGCNSWHTGCLPNGGAGTMYTCGCGKSHPVSGFNATYSDFFDAIEETHYEDVTKELAKLPQDEVPDVKQIKELI